MIGYGQIETFGTILLHLSEQARMQIYEGCGDTPTTLQVILEYANRFDEQWERMSQEEHEKQGDDYFEEVARLTNWMELHTHLVVQKAPYRREDENL